MPNLQVTPVIGLPQFNGWSQVITNTSHSVVCALAIAGTNAGNTGRDLAAQLAESEPTSETEFHTLLTELLLKTRNHQVTLQVAAGFFQPQGCVLATYQGVILLKRGPKNGVILQSDSELRIIQGHYQPEDIFVFATDQASHFLGEIQQKLARGYDIDTIITSVVPAVHGVSDSALSSLGFTLIKEPITAGDNQRAFSATIAPPIEDALPSGVAATSTPTDPVPPPPTTPTRAWKLPTFSPVFKRFGSGTVRSWARLNDRSSTYVEDSPWYRRRWLLIALVLIFAAGAITFWVWRWRSQTQVSAAQLALTPLIAQMQQAQELKDSDVLASRARAAAVISHLETLQAQFKDQPAGLAVINQALAEAKATAESLSGQDTIQELPIFYDLRLAMSDFVATQADSSDTQAVFFDQGTGRLVLLNLQSKQFQEQTVANETFKDLVVGEPGLLLLSSKVDRFSVAETLKDRVTLLPESDEIRQSTLLATYGTAVYLLNPQQRNITKSAPGDGNTYTAPVRWLRSGQNLVTDSVHSWSIDGDVWIGAKDGKIIKLTSGQVVPFNVTGLSTPFDSPLTVVTRAALPQIYVLEPNRKRVVILNKTGEFVREVSSPGLGSATHLLISTELKKLLAVSGSLVFEIPL